MRNTWIYTIMILALFATSCSDRMDEPDVSDKTRKVVFRLSVDDAVGSRAAWNEDYESSNAEAPFDTRIRANDLQVVVYSGNSCIGKATNVVYWTVNGGENSNTQEEYRFVGDVSHLGLQEGQSYRVMVLANCDDVGATTNIGQHPFDISDMAYDTGYIPMWGVTTMTLGTEELQDLEMIHLLRAAAKIEVELAGDEMTGYTLESVTLNHGNTRGYCAPTGWDTVAETLLLNQESCANFHTSRSEDSQPFVIAADGRKSVIYVPECNNRHTSDHAVTISVVLKKGDNLYQYEDGIKFYKYKDGSIATGVDEEEYDIIRNHHYKFSVTGVSGGLEIQYVVMDWTDAGEVDLGEYAYPTYHNPLLPRIPINNEQIEITETPTMYHKLDGNGKASEEGAFVAYFRMTAGQNTWTPTIKASVTDYAVRVYGSNNELLYSTIAADGKSTTAQLVASDEWYQIKVIPLDANKTGTKVDLGITYRISDALSTPLYLFINGTSASDIRWTTESGTDPKFIKITQVEESSQNL